MNQAAASAAVYSLVAILLLAALAGLLPELFRTSLRLRVLELRLRAEPGSLPSAAAQYLLACSPALWLRWAGRGFPPLATLLDPAEVESVLARLRFQLPDPFPEERFGPPPQIPLL